MDSKELRQKSNEELMDLLRDTKSRAAAFRWDAAQKKVKNVKELSAMRKDIARILTVFKEKSNGA